MSLEYEIVSPDPSGTIASLSSLGYSVQSAVADLIDNSVAASALSVEVVFTWAGRRSWIAVVDDGNGMTDDELRTAMAVAARGPGVTRSADDLGRFGMGLKTASFSQARQLTVSTTVDGGTCWSTRTWDLDTVGSTGEWRLLRGADDDTEAVLDRVRRGSTRGTIVLWRRLQRFDIAGTSDDDTVVQRLFYADRDRVEAHLAMVFNRFLSRRSRRLVLLVNGSAVRPWDPFLALNPAVQRLPVEVLPVDDRTVRVEPFVLPHPKRLEPDSYERAGGPQGWLDQQGFYVYRRDRLILAGDWLGLRGLRRDEKFNLARISVDIPAELDSQWGIDVRKSAAVPPVAVRGALRRIGSYTRDKAKEVITHAGRVAARTHGADFIYAWRVERRNGRVACRVNREHPLIREMLRGGTDAASDVRALVQLLEETVPVAALRVMHEADTVDDPEPFAEVPDDETLAVAERIYNALLSDGRTTHEAKQRLRLMPGFDTADGFWQH